MIDIMSLMAKTDPFVSLFDHCVATGKAAGVLWDLGVIENKTIKRDALCLLTALHDVGKCHPFFDLHILWKVSFIIKTDHIGT